MIEELTDERLVELRRLRALMPLYQQVLYDKIRPAILTLAFLLAAIIVRITTTLEVNWVVFAFISLFAILSWVDLGVTTYRMRKGVYGDSEQECREAVKYILRSR
jgi:membrane protein YdbS with pleckstrin-like domain